MEVSKRSEQIDIPSKTENADFDHFVHKEHRKINKYFDKHQEFYDAAEK